MDYLIVSIVILELNLVTECHDPSHSVFHVQFFQSSMSRLNWFPSFIRINWIESYNLTQLVLSVGLNKLSLIPHYLSLIIIYTPMFLPSNPLGRW